jgi:hypothetical protein
MTSCFDQDAHLPDRRRERDAVLEVEDDRGHERGLLVGIDLGGVLLANRRAHAPVDLAHLDGRQGGSGHRPGV